MTERQNVEFSVYIYLPTPPCHKVAGIRLQVSSSSTMTAYFPMIAFNHDQLKAASTGSILLARRSTFDVVARRLSAVNYLVAGNIADRMAAGDHVRPSNSAEQICFDLIKDLDGIAGRVKGSSRQRNTCETKSGRQLLSSMPPSYILVRSPSSSSPVLCTD